MNRYLVSVKEMEPSYWCVLFNDGSFERLDFADNYGDAVIEADSMYGSKDFVELVDFTEEDVV